MRRSFYAQKRPSLDFPRHLESNRIVMVSPYLAYLWLSKNPENRPISNKLVNEYAEKILSGEWKDEGKGFQPLIVINDGTLINGQHRLCAIVKADKAVKMRVWVMEKTSPRT